MHRVLLALLTCLGALVLAGCSDSPLPRPPRAALLSSDPALLELSPLAHASRPRLAGAGPYQLFISGHSLVDQPLPEQHGAIAADGGRTLAWKARNPGGSSILQRGPAELPQGTWDALLITEQHAVLASWAWQDTPRQLRRWHDALIARNPDGVTYFFVPWMSMNDPADPTRLNPALDSGDGLHPSLDGYRAMAAAVPLELLR